MPVFKFLVAENVRHEVTYTILAESEEEARSKAEIGDTEDELSHDRDEVLSRYVLERV